MGSKPSSVKGTLVATAVAGGGNVCHIPQQAMTASAPPTPQRPDGAPRPGSPGSPGGAAASGPEVSGGGPAGTPLAQNPPTRTPVHHATHTGVAGGWMAATYSEYEALASNSTPNPDGPLAATLARPSAFAPVSSEHGALDGILRFDTPLEEVLQQATESFGSIASALSSPKWDRRVQALNAIGTVIKGLNLKAASGVAQRPQPSREACRGLKLRDNVRCFRAACLILNVALRDKVLPVLFAAHELYRLTFEHGQALVPQEEATHALGTLLQHILAKLGDINIRLHDSACATFVFSTGPTPRLSLSLAFARLQQHLDDSTARGQQRMRVHGGVLDVVSLLMKRFPARRAGEGDASDAAASWNVADIAPFVVAGMQVDAGTGSRVRQAAASLVVILYTTLGKRCLDEVMAQLSEASRELVTQKIAEETGLITDGDLDDSDEEAGGGDEDLAASGGASLVDLCVTGVAIKPPTALERAKTAQTDGQEEDFMDEILEETGLVFQGHGLSVNPQLKDSLACNRALDEDLRTLGLLV